MSEQSGDRRTNIRCEVCNGPTRVDESGVVKCRNSLCAFNHLHVKCPRCGANSLEHVEMKPNNHYEYVCKECKNKWYL
jgi:hypothetical protein